MSSQLKGIIFKCLIVALIILFFIFIGKKIFNSVKYGEGISGVRNELSEKYDNILCIREDCNGILTYSNNKTVFYDKQVSKITSFNDFTDNVIDIADTYYIALMDNVYYLKDFNKKQIYKSNDYLNKINDNLIMEGSKKIIDKTGKELYKDLEYITIYYDGKYILTFKDDKYNILDEKGNVLFKNKRIENIIRNEYNDEKAFLIYDEKSKKYSYYNIEDEKLFSEEFTSYNVINDTYVVNYKDKEYILKIDGSLVLLSGNEDNLKEKVTINSDEKNIIVKNSKEKEVIKIAMDNALYLSDNNYIYEKDGYIKFYNVSKDKIYEYKLKENEALIYSPFRKTVFIYNEKDKYLKLIDFKGDLIKKLDSDEMPIIKFNSYNKNAYIITMNDSKYGLYIAN